ncbi:PR-1-like protein [Cadophora sp. DSE1049]|nr:PR-1-like protein [Cadophora sp. DSE1049]
MADRHQQSHSPKWTNIKALSLLFFLASRTLAHNDTRTVPAVFDAATLQNREPTDLSFADNTHFQTQVMDDHNFFRSQHGAHPLRWSNQLAQSRVGENLALGYSRVLDAINAWGLERGEYNFNSPGFGLTTGHFTQMVWKRTTEVGCAKRQCQIQDFADGKPSWYVVCQYQAPGNVKNPGFFEENVGRQISGDPAVGIPGTLSSTPPKSSASPVQTTAPVATNPPKTVTVGASDPLPEVVVVTITVTEGDDPAEASFPAETGKTAAAPKSTSGPFWGRLKSSGTTMDTSFFHVLRRRSGTVRLEGNIFLATVGVLVAMFLALV